jgi:hypothetical protein
MTQVEDAGWEAFDMYCCDYSSRVDFHFCSCASDQKNISLDIAPILEMNWISGFARSSTGLCEDCVNEIKVFLVPDKK